jgi:hypothetical protein
MEQIGDKNKYLQRLLSKGRPIQVPQQRLALSLEEPALLSCQLEKSRGTTVHTVLTYFRGDVTGPVQADTSSRSFACTRLFSGTQCKYNIFNI